MESAQCILFKEEGWVESNIELNAIRTSFKLDRVQSEVWGCVNGVSVRGLGSKHSDEKKDKSISKIRVYSKNDNSSNNKHHRDNMDRDIQFKE